MAGKPNRGRQANDVFELYEQWDKAKHAELLETCRRLTGFPRLVITFLEGCSLTQKIDVLKHYHMDVEICCPVYVRNASAWTDGTHIQDFIEHVRVTFS